MGPPLVHRPQFRTVANESFTAVEAEFGFDTRPSDDAFGNTRGGKDSKRKDDESQVHLRRIQLSLDEFNNLIREQGDGLNSKWFQEFDERGASGMTLFEENSRLKRNRLMPRI